MENNLTVDPDYLKNRGLHNHPQYRETAGSRSWWDTDNSMIMGLQILGNHIRASIYELRSE